MSLFAELKRRNVIRVAIAYAVVSWVLIQIGNILFSTLELGAEPGKILLAILLLGFIPAVIFAWAFEITPEGIKKEKDVERDASITNLTAKRLDMVTIGLLVVAIGLFGLDRLSPRDVQTQDVQTDTTESINNASNAAANSLQVAAQQSIAVLPFVNMSSDAEQEYFSDGITEEILNALAKIKQLKVVGRTSSFSFKGKNQDLRLIGDTLGVAHILEGSVRKAGTQVRITAQLIKVDDGFHMWSETYDGSLENVFDLQENISRKVSDELKLVMNIQDDTRLASKMTNNVDAYDLFLRGREHIGKRIDGHLPKGIALLEQAVKLDPNFAEAWAVMAEAEAVSDGYLPVSAEEAHKRAQAHIETAKALDPSLVLPYAVSGLIMGSSLEKNYVGAINDLQQALELDANNVQALRWLGNFYHTLGYFDKALPLYEQAFKLEPLSSVEAFNLAVNKLNTGDLETSNKYFYKVNDLRGRLSMDIIAFVLSAQGNNKAAVDYYMQLHSSIVEQYGASKLVSEEETRQFALAAFGGDKSMKLAAQASGKIMDNGPDDSRQSKLPSHIALENYDRVYEILEKKPDFFSTFSADYMWFDLPSFKAFRQDSRFAPLLERFGFPVAWNELGWPDICKPNAGTDGSNGQFSCE